MLLAEELVLLALDPERGRPVNGSESPLATCLAGALVCELALAGVVVLEGRRFAVTGVPPAGGLLAEAHAVLASSRGRRSTDQLRRVDRELGRTWKRVVDRLVAAQVLGRDPRGPLRPTAHPVLRLDLREEVVRRLREAAAGSGPIEPRTAAVLALSGPARLLEVVADAPHGHAKRRIAQAAALTPEADVVRAVLAEAASAAAVVAVSASASGGGDS